MFMAMQTRRMGVRCILRNQKSKEREKHRAKCEEQRESKQEGGDHDKEETDERTEKRDERRRKREWCAIDVCLPAARTPTMQWSASSIG